jgi:DNA-binding MarR family transcriptional regulator
MLQLSPKDRALLHLYDSRSHLTDRPSEALTQQGIASALEVNRTHITRVMKPLVDAGLVEVGKGRLEGGDRKMSYYLLTPTGLVRAKELIDSLGEEELELVEEGKKVRRKVRDALKAYPYLRSLEVIDSIGGVLRPQDPGKRLILSEVELRTDGFIGREEQLATAKEFLSGPSLVLAIYANHGYGSSTFLRKVAADLFDGAILWHDLSKSQDPAALKRELDRLSALLGAEQSIDGLKGEPALICLDNYRQLSEAMVDFLTDLVPRLRRGRCKMAVSMREETPSYERFYLRPDVLSGEVVEVRLHRFDEATAREFLGGGLDDEAFQLIYMLTRGQPLALDMVKRGDAEGLKELRLSEEVRFLMYLRTRKEGSRKSN